MFCLFTVFWLEICSLFLFKAGFGLCNSDDKSELFLQQYHMPQFLLQVSLVSSLGAAPPRCPLQPHHSLFLQWAEVQDGQDCVERLLPPTTILKRQELEDNILQVLHVGALAAVVPQQFFELTT